MAKEDQAPAVETAEDGGKKKKLIITVAAVAVALILCVVAFIILGKGGKEGKAALVKGGYGAAAPATGGASPSINIFPLEPFIVNIYDGQELRYLKVKIELEMVDPAIKTEIERRMAPIRDSVLILLSAKTLQDIQDVQGKNMLKDEIQAAINKNIPPGKISKVYFTDFIVQ